MSAWLSDPIHAALLVMGACCLFLLALHAQERYLRRRFRAANDQNVAGPVRYPRLRDPDERLVPEPGPVEALDGIAATLARAQEALENAARTARDERARADRYFSSVEKIERERNQWQQAYESSVAGHGRAQELMMREVGRLAHRLRRAKALLDAAPLDVAELRRTLDTAPNEVLAAVQAQYGATHDPESGMASAIERPTLDLTPEERAARQIA